MIDQTLLIFSFVQGVLAFFAPCAVALLPGYIAAFISKEEERATKKQLLFRAIVLGAIAILGITIVYAIGSILIYTIASIVKKYMVYVAMTLGVAVIIMGLFMIAGKTVSLPIHGPNTQVKNDYLEALIFGIAYGIGALGCLFPLFLVVAVTALQAPNLLISASYFLAYAGGMAIFMFAFFLMAVFAKQFLQEKVHQIMPYIVRIAGVVVVLAGIYIIWYQSSLL